MSHFSTLDAYKIKVELSIKEFLQAQPDQGILHRACEYALLNGGKRIRPALVLMIAHSLNTHVDVSSAALCVEFFHTASLIADDLPCMDNDSLRRGLPTVHCAFGESVAILATYALISAGYECIAKASQSLKNHSHVHSQNADALGILALKNISTNTGLQGITGGQQLDLNPNTQSLTFFLEVMHKKTVTLFEVSFVLGWIFGGGNQEQLSLIKKCAGHFGLAFQLADDIEDAIQDSLIETKLNCVNLYGLEQTLQMFHEEIGHCQVCLQDLNLYQSDIKNLLEDLKTSVNKTEASPALSLSLC